MTFTFGHSADDWRQLAANIRRAREIFTKLADMEEPMTTPRCEQNVQHITCPHCAADVVFMLIDTPQHSAADWADAGRLLAERTRECLHEVGSPMARFDRGERSEDLWQTIQHILSQHSDDQWFAALGRLVNKHPMTVDQNMINFFNGDRSQSLWDAMQQAVNQS